MHWEETAGILPDTFAFIRGPFRRLWPVPLWSEPSTDRFHRITQEIVRRKPRCWYRVRFPDEWGSLLALSVPPIGYLNAEHPLSAVICPEDVRGSLSEGFPDDTDLADPRTVEDLVTTSQHHAASWLLNACVPGEVSSAADETAWWAGLVENVPELLQAIWQTAVATLSQAPLDDAQVRVLRAADMTMWCIELTPRSLVLSRVRDTPHELVPDPGADWYIDASRRGEQ